MSLQKPLEFPTAFQKASLKITPRTIPSDYIEHRYFVKRISTPRLPHPTFTTVLNLPLWHCISTVISDTSCWNTTLTKQQITPARRRGKPVIIKELRTHPFHNHRVTFKETCVRCLRAEVARNGFVEDIAELYMDRAYTLSLSWCTMAKQTFF